MARRRPFRPLPIPAPAAPETPDGARTLLGSGTYNYQYLGESGDTEIDCRGSFRLNAGS